MNAGALPLSTAVRLGCNQVPSTKYLPEEVVRRIAHEVVSATCLRGARFCFLPVGEGGFGEERAEYGRGAATGRAQQHRRYARVRLGRKPALLRFSASSLLAARFAGRGASQVRPFRPPLVPRLRAPSPGRSLALAGEGVEVVVSVLNEHRGAAALDRCAFGMQTAASPRLRFGS